LNKPGNIISLYYYFDLGTKNPLSQTKTSWIILTAGFEIKHKKIKKWLWTIFSATTLCYATSVTVATRSHDIYVH